MGLSSIQVNVLAEAVANQNIKKAMVYPPCLEISNSGKVMSRRTKGSTNIKKTMVATPAEKNEGHKMAPNRCVKDLGGSSLLMAQGLVLLKLGLHAQDIGGDQFRPSFTQKILLGRHHAISTVLNGVSDIGQATTIGIHTTG